MNDWKVVHEESGNEWYVDSRPEAEERIQDVSGLRDPEEFEIIPPSEDIEPPVEDQTQEAKADGGAVEAELVDESEESETPEPPEPKPSGSTYELPERSVSDDPMKWVPGEFVDTIDGTQAINRKGFAVLGHFYKIETSSEVVVSPEETDFEFCRVRAVATTKDGREYEAHGSAHVDRGDDSFLLLEMADTRAKKRALADATGVGAVAVSELKNEVQS